MSFHLHKIYSNSDSENCDFTELKLQMEKKKSELGTHYDNLSQIWNLGIQTIIYIIKLRSKSARNPSIFSMTNYFGCSNFQMIK